MARSYMAAISTASFPITSALSNLPSSARHRADQAREDHCGNERQIEALVTQTSFKRLNGSPEEIAGLAIIALRKVDQAQPVIRYYLQRENSPDIRDGHCTLT